VSSLFILCDLVISGVQHLILLMNDFLLLFQGCHFDLKGLLMILFTHLLSLLQEISDTVIAPIVFAHNDFLSRNVMFNKEEGWPSCWLEV
jgi:hypothetical protein